VENQDHGSGTENELRGVNTITTDSEGPAVRRLAPSELVELRQDMAESSAWAKAELKRRRALKKSKKS
jgi:hypothetical protein